MYDGLIYMYLLVGFDDRIGALLLPHWEERTLLSMRLVQRSSCNLLNRGHTARRGLYLLLPAYE